MSQNPSFWTCVLPVSWDSQTSASDLKSGLCKHPPRSRRGKRRTYMKVRHRFTSRESKAAKKREHGEYINVLPIWVPARVYWTFQRLFLSTCTQQLTAPHRPPKKALHLFSLQAFELLHILPRENKRGKLEFQKRKNEWNMVKKINK